MIEKEIFQKDFTSRNRIAFRFKRVYNDYDELFFWSIPKGTLTRLIFTEKEYKDGQIEYRVEVLISVDEGENWSYGFMLNDITKIERYEKLGLDPVEVLFDGSK